MSFGQGCPELVGACDPPGVTNGVAVASVYAYLAAGYSGLRVVNVSNPSAPVEVGHFDTPGEARGIAVADSYAYVGGGATGLLAVDVSDPLAPVEVGFYDTPDFYPVGVVVVGPYAYAADFHAGVAVLTTCAGLLFADDFERGTTSAWTVTAP